MKKWFTFKSTYYLSIAVFGAAAMVLLPVMTAVLFDSTTVGLITLISAMLIYIISLHLAACVPCVISADDDALRVAVCWKKYVFPYKDIEKAEKLINEMADQGWILQQVATPDDGVGAMVGVFYKERKL